jgi:trk system potassium uptake protein TrkH
MSLRVDSRSALALVGIVLKYLAVALLVPAAVGLYYGRGVVPFLVTAGLAVVVGLALERLEPDPDPGIREGFLLVATTWLAVSLIGAVPYVLAGAGVPGLVEASGSTLANPVNALFESTSGFTTTGATVMGEISTERHSRALLLWRQLSQWLGGMGIVVLAVAILPELSVGGAQLMDAEAPGPGVEKLTPRIAETARALWLAYVGITALEVAGLYALHLGGMAPNMTPYNAVAHGLTTLSTGGFSPEARSIEAFSAAVQWLIVPFMLAAGTNFALFWRVLDGEPGHLVTDREFRTYAGVIATLTAVIGGVLFLDPALAAVDAPSTTITIEGDAEAALRHGAFQAAALTTTTGYASMDFTAWSGPGQAVLVVAMFLGGSAGSTAGGIKIVRWLLVTKVAARELFTTVHPEAVRPVRLGGRALDERAVRGVLGFTLLYLGGFLLGTLLLAVDAGRAGMDLTAIEAITACAATIGNVGPGLGLVGPMGSYLAFPATSKLLMVGLMWVGRLEILPVLVLLTPAYWRS